MSGFLSRLAARASGAPVGVTPRVPARFERADTLGSATGHPTGASEVLERPAAPVVVAAVPTEPSPVSQSTYVKASQGLSVDRSPTPRRRRPAQPRDPRPDAAAPVAAVEHREASTDRSPSVAASPRPIGGQPQAPRVVAVPARPTAIPPPPPAGPASLSVASAAGAPNTAPHVVHVTIGRVEVRAAVSAPLPVPAAPANTGSLAETLPLTAYLRGERTGR
jgi:hypothetical protein